MWWGMRGRKYATKIHQATSPNQSYRVYSRAISRSNQTGEFLSIFFYKVAFKYVVLFLGDLFLRSFEGDYIDFGVSK
jgi:hypothetical protein